MCDSLRLRVPMPFSNCLHVRWNVSSLACLSRTLSQRLGMSNSTPRIESVLRLFTKLQTKTKNVRNVYNLYSMRIRAICSELMYKILCKNSSHHESSAVLPLNMGSSKPGKRPIFLTSAASALLLSGREVKELKVHTGDAVAYKHLLLNLSSWTALGMSTRAFASWIHVPCAKVIAWGCLRLVRMVGACEGGKPDLNAQLAETIFSAASLGAANLLVHISCADTNGWVVSWQSLAVRLTMLRKYMCRCYCVLAFSSTNDKRWPNENTVQYMVIVSASADLWCHFKPMKPWCWALWNFLCTTSTTYKLWIWSPNADSPASATDSLWPCNMFFGFTSSYLHFTSLNIFFGHPKCRSIWANGNVAHGLGGIPDTHMTEETLSISI